MIYNIILDKMHNLSDRIMELKKDTTAAGKKKLDNARIEYDTLLGVIVTSDNLYKNNIDNVITVDFQNKRRVA